MLPPVGAPSGPLGVGRTCERGQIAVMTERRGSDDGLEPPRRRLCARYVQPLDDAFRQRTNVWRGPVVSDAAQLTESFERQTLAGRTAVIAAYGGFDPTREPVLLIHGFGSSGGDLRDIAKRLCAEDRQVFFVFYDDRATLTHRNAEAVASAIAVLRREHYKRGTRLDIVGHSMGGVVAGAALNELQQPGWFRGNTVPNPVPRGGFGPTRLRSIDTPWDGCPPPPDAIAPLADAIAAVGAAAIGYLGAWEMRANSELFRSIYSVRLAGVDIQNTAAINGDLLRDLSDYSVQDQAAIARFALGGQVPPAHRPRNMAFALQQDSRFPALQERLRMTARATSSDADLARALDRAYRQLMPGDVGGHNEVQYDVPGREYDAVDRVIRELGRRSE